MTQAIGGVALLVALAGALATLLGWARRRWAVREDPRLLTVAGLLPQANCGACGYPGCQAFAEALVESQVNPAACTVSTLAQRQQLAEVLGVGVDSSERRVARLLCAGGTNVALQRAHYRGVASCWAAADLGGGGKACAWGCFGLGDCQRSCTFDAISMSPHELPLVDAARCTACGDCVQACPRDLFRLLPESKPLLVRCSSQERGELATAACEVACNACGRCALDAPHLVRMGPRSLPLVDYGQLHGDRRAMERCPTGAIVWVAADHDHRGPAAPSPQRREALPPLAS